MSSRPTIPNVSQHGYSSFRTDLFGRIKTSEPFTLFDSTHRYQQNQDYSNEVVGNGSVSYIANESSVSLNINRTQGDKVTSESFRVFAYQPGKSLQVMQTFVMAPAQTNLRQRVGYFSRQNGFFLEQDGTAVYLVKRSFISGSVVETRIPQAQWNVDPLDGTGPSDLVLDLSKAQIFWSEYEWLGVGSVRLGFAIDGFFIPVHVFNHANHISSVYMTTATLPVRYEIENTGATAVSSSFKQICTSVISNGGYTRKPEISTAWRETFASVGTDRYPLIAIRMKAGRTDSIILPVFVDIISSSQGVGGWAVIKNPTSITGGTWTTYAPENNVEYNSTATSMSQDGQVMRRSFVSSTNQSGSSNATITEPERWDLQLGRTNSNNPVSDVYVLTFRTLSGTMNVQGLFGWHDLL